MNKEDFNQFPCPEEDKSGATGVLLSDQIEHYAMNYRMIYPFSSTHLKPAGYKLTLGEEYAIGGKSNRLSSDPGNDTITIPPFEVAIITTNEIINLPRFIIARWNLRVSKVYEGLLWTGALQVDPGWYGRLACPIYNLSAEPVTLKLGAEVVLMDFVKTTPFKKGLSIEYPRPPLHQNLEDYHYKLKSALYTEAAAKIKKTEEKLNAFESIFFLIITILFASLAIFTTYASDKSTKLTISLWSFISTIFSITALAVSLLAYTKKQQIWKLFATIIGIYLLFGIAYYFIK